EQLEADEEEEDEDELDDKADPDSVLSSGPLPSADLLIRDVEELLRLQREDGPGRPSSNDDNEEKR
ncbi:MAG: hypothetical protein J2P36_30130, partial [Ktedonobacteraceae bacterium]|nr:hypothetical protein [Ktedonobacteraceae bacterium]